MQTEEGWIGGSALREYWALASVGTWKRYLAWHMNMTAIGVALSHLWNNPRIIIAFHPFTTIERGREKVLCGSLDVTS
eukprot:scaffold277969_cov32-Tisochrysis_lutea.AAC.6